MSGTLVECVPNFSEGRDIATIDGIVEAIHSAGAVILDRTSDPDHHPSVVTFAAPAAAIGEGAFRAVRQAISSIDLNPLSGPDAGDYFHDQFNGRGWTHGCLCYGTDPRMINYIWNSMPNTWVGVSVDVSVVKP